MSSELSVALPKYFFPAALAATFSPAVAVDPPPVDVVVTGGVVTGVVAVPYFQASLI